MRTIALARRILRQLAADHRTIALVVVAPCVILTLFSLIFAGADYHPRIAAVDLPEDLLEELQVQKARVQVVSAAGGESLLRQNQVDAVILLKDDNPSVWLEGSDPTISRSVLLLLRKVSEQINPMMGPGPEIKYLYGSENMSTFDNFGPVMVGLLVFFFTFLISGVSFLRERMTGTLERLFSTPIHRWEVVLGYLLAFSVIMVAQSTVLVTYTVYALDMNLVGSFFHLLLITLLLASTALTLGMFLSAFARSDFQMFQFVPIVLVPQVFFSGLFNLETMLPILRYIGKVLPLTYGAHALREIMIRGGGWLNIQGDVFVLVGLTLLFLAANAISLRRYRRY